MKKLQEFMIKGLPLPECEEEDEDTQEKETKEIKEVSGEGGPAGGGIGSDNVEPAAEDTIIQEDKEREALLALRQRDTSLYGMSKNEARSVLKSLGYSDLRIKSVERQKEDKINSKLNELGLEFPGRRASSENNHDDLSLNNIYDGSALGFDNNISDISDQMDPNTDVEEPLYGIIKPYDTQHQTQPSSLTPSGEKGYKGSIPSYTGIRDSKKIDIKKLIEKAIAKGYSKQQIKMMFNSLPKQ